MYKIPWIDLLPLMRIKMGQLENTPDMTATAARRVTAYTLCNSWQETKMPASVANLSPDSTFVDYNTLSIHDGRTLSERLSRLLSAISANNGGMGADTDEFRPKNRLPVRV